MLDLRPRVDNASTINAGDGQDRQYSGTGASTVEFAKFNTDITADLEFYLSRRDKVFMASNGDFKVISGASAVEPIEPEGIADAMLLYKMFVPAFTFNTADIKITPQDNRRYTMRDIGGLAKRLENVEYYTQLSLLEADAQSLQIQDANGFDRFKNGILVDPFTGHNVGSVLDPNYRISIDPKLKHARPFFVLENIRTQLFQNISNTATYSGTALRLTGSTITSPYNTRILTEQQQASQTENLVKELTFHWSGDMVLTPDVDNFVDTSVQPAINRNFDFNYDNWENMANAWGTQWGSWEDSGAANVTSSTESINQTIYSKNSHSISFYIESNGFILMQSVIVI